MSSIINNSIATVHTPKMRQYFAQTAWTIATLTVKQRFGPKCDISWEPCRQPKRPKPANFKVAVFAGLASLEDTVPRSDHSSFVYNKRVWSSCRWLKATIRLYSNSRHEMWKRGMPRATPKFCTDSQLVPSPSG